MVDNVTLEQRAAASAWAAHGTQVRKYTGEPYATHCAEVADLVRTVPHTEEMLAAAWLHDTVEDCGVTVETLAELFGDHVAMLVWELTDQSKGSTENRKARKAEDRLHLSKASPEAQTVKYADLLSNTVSILEHDPAFAKVYLREKLALLEVMTRGDQSLYARAYKAAEMGLVQLGLTRVTR